MAQARRFSEDQWSCAECVKFSGMVCGIMDDRYCLDHESIISSSGVARQHAAGEDF